ncbi:hypothetical protein F2P81_017755 [Scophthalmus maximus]|uniref:Uncharacterized protein n=1 Tax=Scophthalmus maximus TaxID=52904 RepID=A0A6A4SJ75_SCOMX|nr:hypothetical protein F2P81_017755 [Scophthalmus maximus]
MAEGTRVIYHLEDQETPYLIRINVPAQRVTLADFKQVLNKPNVKFFFKSEDDDFGVVKEEINDDDVRLPCVNGRVVCWVVSSDACQSDVQSVTTPPDLAPPPTERPGGIGDSRPPSFHDISAIVRAMANPESGLEVRDRMWLKITIPNAFIGSDVVDWLHRSVDGFSDRRDARKFAGNLLRDGHIRHTVNKVTFSEQCYYVFADVCGAGGDSDNMTSVNSVVQFDPVTVTRTSVYHQGQLSPIVTNISLTRRRLCLRPHAADTETSGNKVESSGLMSGRSTLIRFTVVGGWKRHHQFPSRVRQLRTDVSLTSTRQSTVQMDVGSKSASISGKYLPDPE